MTDDQSQKRIREESEALERIFELVWKNTVIWSASTILQFELSKNPDDHKRQDALALLGYAVEVLEPDDLSTDRAIALESLGYGPFDAFHLAMAEKAGAQGLITTDDRFINRARRGEGNSLVEVTNPIDWLRKASSWLPPHASKI